MNVQQKIEKWCRNERFVHYANERISEELVYAPNHRIDPEYEELDEAITWDNRYIVPMMTYPIVCNWSNCRKMPRIETAVSGGYSCM